MSSSKGIVAGFAAGLAVAGGAVLLLRNGAPMAEVPDNAQVAELRAEVGRLHESVRRLSEVVASGTSKAGNAPAPAPAAQPASAVDTILSTEQQQALATATQMVDQALLSRRWTRSQQAELMVASAGLGAEERGALMARVMAAVNRNELIVERR